MKTLKNLLLIVALVGAPSFVMAQSQPTRTTLSAAMAYTDGTLTVTSATGINATSATLGQENCLVDQELMRIRSISSATLTVTRNIQGFRTAHVSGAPIICGVSGSFNPSTGSISAQVGSPTVGAAVTGATFIGSLPVGSCTRSAQAILPVFFITAGPVGAGRDYGYSVDCLGGQWVAGSLASPPTDGSLILASNVPIGSVAYASIGTATVADIATVEWLTSIDVPKSGWITGARFLCGSTCTTDKALAVLRDSSGNKIANSTTAGVLVSGASTFQTLAFTAPIYVVGPARYFVGIQGNGTAAAFLNAVKANSYVNVVTGELTGGTFGTIVSPATMPTTFTADEGPVVELYY